MTRPTSDRQRPHRRGVALVLAIVVVGLTGILLATLTARATMQQRRTIGSEEDAQAAQLLAAGVRTAQSQLAAGTPRDGAVETPVGEVRLAWSGADAAKTCTVTATFDQARRAVSVRFNGVVAVSVD